jgi:hypothetical protein
MGAGVEAMPRGLGRRSVDRLVAAFLLVLLGIGSLMLWIGIPIAGLWGFSKLTRSWNMHFLLSLVFIPIAMALFSPALFFLNNLYLRVTGVIGQADEDEDRERRLRGPLELFLYFGMVLALAALFGWFFFFAENPPEIVW